MQAHNATGAVLVGTDTGACAVYDAGSGQQTWGTDTGCQINAAAIVPAPDVRSVVTVHEDGCLRLLDLRRQVSSAELACVQTGEQLTCVATDGCCAVAGSSDGGLVVWNLDPASEEAAEDGAGGIASVGGGTAFRCILEGRDGEEVTGLVVEYGQEAGWCLAAAHMGGRLDFCAFDDAG
jgi:WD40 repeat protein